MKAVTTVAPPRRGRALRDVAGPSRSRFQVVRRLWENKLGVASAFVLLLLCVVALLPSLFAPADPSQQNLAEALQGPSARYWLGTDAVGRDVLSRLVYGTRTSLGASLLAVGVAVALGVPAGLYAGHAGGRMDTLVRSFFDGMMSIPAMILAIAVVGVLGPGLVNSMTVIGVIFAPRIFRIQRGTTLEVRREPYVEGCQAIGCSAWRILWRHVLPNSLSPTIVQISILLGLGIMSEASMSFVGLGAQPPTPSWGTLLNEAFRYMNRAPYLSIPPGVAVVVAVGACSWLGDAIRDALSGRRRSL